MQKPYILIIEDEPDISTLLQYNLENADFEVSVAETGFDGFDSVNLRVPDLILMDWMLPEISGIDLCKKLREDQNNHDIPIIMLTARGEEADKIKGLNAGIDDYVTKPFSVQELILRIKAILRRAKPSLTEKMIEYEGLQIHLKSRQAMYKDKILQIGPTEYRLLQYFIEHPQQICSRSQLLTNVWGGDNFIDDRTVDVHIRRLRKAMELIDDNLSDYIKTVRSIGYVLEKD